MTEREVPMPVPRPSAAPPPAEITVFDVLRARATARMIHHAAESELLILRDRERVAEARIKTEAAERELAFQRTLRTLPAAEACRLLDEEFEVERRLVARNRLRRGTWSAASAEDAALAADTGSGRARDVDWEITSEQIEALAARAVSRLQQLPLDEGEPWWQQWLEQLRLRLPPYAAREVARRAEELRSLSR